MLDPARAILVLVDLQGKLLASMHRRAETIDTCRRLVRVLQTLQVPILRTEQDPDHMGHTVADLTNLLQSAVCVRKLACSACGEPVFTEALRAVDRPQVLLAGVESHVAVYLTARDLIASGREVWLVTDGITSRQAELRALGFDMSTRAGAQLTCLETASYEMLGGVDHPLYRLVSGFLP